MVTITVAGHAIALLPQKAALIVDSRTLLIADAHVGKATSFRALGVPVPRGTTSETLAALSELIGGHAARRVVFLGDFLHSRRAQTSATTLAALSRWRDAHATLPLTLVRGNHDDRAGDPPASLGIEVVDEPLRDGALALCHHPAPCDGAYVVAGHLHPCVSLHGRAHEHLRLPCFHVGTNVMVLPAFGSFTGMHAVERGEGDRVFAVAGDAVKEVP